MITAIDAARIAPPCVNREPGPHEVTNEEPAVHPPSLADTIRAALQDMPRCQPGDTKDHIRAMHEAARKRHLADHEKWTRNAWRLRQHFFANGADLDPEAISPRMILVVTTEQRDLFRLARYTWSPALLPRLRTPPALSHRGRWSRQRRNGDTWIAIPTH